MIKKSIVIPKTARYFLSGEASETIEEVWFVCHGYGQLASYFIKNFDVLNTEKRLIVAPEGLHRFYWEKFSGRVVASWMTKEDREDDIHDYVRYLDAVYTEVISSLRNKNLKITVLGFSQGTATVCRWLAAKNSRADNLILWAGAFPSDMDLQLNKTTFDSIRTLMVIGDRDEFITEEDVGKYRKLLDQNNIRYELQRFSGSHEINREVLERIAKQLQ